MARKKVFKAKEIVHIRTKEISNGNQSIYLDYHFNGERKYEFLKLYFIPEHTAEDKVRNEETVRLVQAIKSKRILQIQAGNLGETSFTTTKHASLIEYLHTLAKKELDRTGNRHSNFSAYNSLIAHLKEFRGDDIKFKHLNKKFMEDFVVYLRNANSLIKTKSKTLTPIALNTQNRLYSKLRFALDEAVEDNIIADNPANKIHKKHRPKTQTGVREYLTA